MKNGPEEIIATLKRLEENVAGKHLRKTLRAGAKVVQRQFKADVPRVTGETASEIRIRAMKRSRTRTGMMVEITRGTPEGFYAGFTNFGHRMGKRLSGWAKAVIGKADSRPAVAGTRWANHAWDESIGSAESEMLETLQGLAEAEGKKGGA